MLFAPVVFSPDVETVSAHGEVGAPFGVDSFGASTTASGIEATTSLALSDDPVTSPQQPEEASPSSLGAVDEVSGREATKVDSGVVSMGSNGTIAEEEEEETARLEKEAQETKRRLGREAKETKSRLEKEAKESKFRMEKGAKESSLSTVDVIREAVAEEKSKKDSRPLFSKLFWDEDEDEEVIRQEGGNVVLKHDGGIIILEPYVEIKLKE